MKNHIKIHLMLFCILAGLQSFPQQDQKSNEEALSPYFLIKSDNPETDQLPLKKTSAEVNIAGMIADVTIRQEYKNKGSNTLEAIYIFPASTNSAVYAMEMFIGNRKITAHIEKKAKARADYNKAKEQGKRASLLEQQRPNVFQMNVANILPGDEISIILKYTVMLTPDEGTYTFVYPTVVGPRYSNELKTEANSGSFVKTPYFHEGEEPAYHFDMRIHLSAGLPIQNIDCKTHDVTTTFQGLDQAFIKLNTSVNNWGNRDFVMKYQLAGEKIASGILLYEHQDEKFFLAMIQPPGNITTEDIPPREYIFINDVSGSMGGYPMDISKKLMRNLVSNLRPEDRFNVLVFAGSSGWWSDKSLAGTPENIHKATAFIDQQQGGGGTEILSAIKKAMGFPREYESLSRSFIIVTDGYVTVEKEVFDLIRKNSNQANTFVFGIGSSVNRHLIEGIAHVGQSEAFIVLTLEDASETAEKFRKYISNPVLTQIKMETSGFDIYDVEPFSIPDVFSERPIIIYGKYRGEATGNISLKGFSGKKRWKSQINVSEARPDNKNAALCYLWARKRIQILDDYARVENLSHEEKITKLGLTYNLLTRYTSFVAIEETKAGDGEYKTIKQALPLPQNVTDAAVGFDMGLEEMVGTDSISFYQNVVIHSGLGSEMNSRLKQYIELTLISSLDHCLLMGENLKSIEVIVDQNGRVSAITPKGISLSKNLTDCLEEVISKWGFQSFSTNRGFSFEIII